MIRPGAINSAKFTSLIWLTDLPKASENTAKNKRSDADYKTMKDLNSISVYSLGIKINSKVGNTHND